MDERPTVRGIVAFEDEETPEWRRAVLTDGTGGVPKFATRSECEDFVRRHCWRGSNPDHPALQHVFTTLVDWRQLQELLLPRIEAYDQRLPPTRPTDVAPDNRFLYDDGAVLTAAVDARLHLPFHRATNRESTIHTLKYLFHHCRCGIFVMIRRRQVVLFVPFVNREFENPWGDHLQFASSDGTPQQYFREKQRAHGRRDHEPDGRRWWSDGHVIHTDDTRGGARGREPASSAQYWDDLQLTQLRDLLEDACQNRNVPDCEFFINKQNYPHLKVPYRLVSARRKPLLMSSLPQDNVTEPFGFLFDKDDREESQDMPLKRHAYPTFAPILSLYTSKRYADIPFPSADDWETATGLLFPQSFSHTHCEQCPCGDANNCENLWECYCDVGEFESKPHGIKPTRDTFTTANFRKNIRSWEEKVNTAVFRGSATGCGTDVTSNQRLRLAELSGLWLSDPNFNGKRSGGVPFLDAAITNIPNRDIKVSGRAVQSINPGTIPQDVIVGGEHYLPLYEQSRFKYIVYVDGVCASKRYAYMMKMGSVILKVESTCVAKERWFSPLLRPYEDHVPVKGDLSDLAEKIQWCREHDDQCQAIAARAQELYERYLSKDAIHDYIEMVCYRIAERFQPAPLWYHRPKGVDTIKKPMLYRPRSMCVSGANPRHCRRCRELKKDEEVRERERRSARDQEREDERGRSGYHRSAQTDHRGDSYRHPRSGSYDDRDSHGGRSLNDRFGDRNARGNSRDHSSPKRQKLAPTVPQCRRCRRAKSACSCSYRR